MERLREACPGIDDNGIPIFFSFYLYGLKSEKLKSGWLQTSISYMNCFSDLCCLKPLIEEIVSGYCLDLYLRGALLHLVTLQAAADMQSLCMHYCYADPLKPFFVKLNQPRSTWIARFFSITNHRIISYGVFSR